MQTYVKSSIWERRNSRMLIRYEYDNHLHKSPPPHEIPFPRINESYSHQLPRYGCFTVVIRLFSVSDYVLFVLLNQYCLMIFPGCMGASVERLAEFCLPSSFPRVCGCKFCKYSVFYKSGNM